MGNQNNVIQSRTRESGDGSLMHKWNETRDVQLTLLLPPKHCPICTVIVRSPSAALGRETYARTVREPGARLFKKRTGPVCAGLLYVVGPASTERIRRIASAVARRPAMTHAAVLPVTFGCPCRCSSRMKAGRKDWEVEHSMTHHLQVQYRIFR